jgi:hypothetical protein
MRRADLLQRVLTLTPSDPFQRPRELALGQRAVLAHDLLGTTQITDSYEAHTHRFTTQATATITNAAMSQPKLLSANWIQVVAGGAGGAGQGGW